MQSLFPFEIYSSRLAIDGADERVEAMNDAPIESTELGSHV
jgi:hypothetical protein